MADNEKKYSNKDVFKMLMRKPQRKITLGSVDIAKANDYIPLVTKQGLVNTLAPLCVVNVKIGGNGSGDQALPDRAQEDTFSKARALMGVFLRFYLNIEFEGWAEDLRIAANLYDVYAGSHIMNQLERLKSESSCRNKIFDMLSDYKQFTSMLNTEIFSILSHKNDVVGRINMVMNAAVDPERMRELVDSLKELREAGETGEGVGDAGGESEY